MTAEERSQALRDGAEALRRGDAAAAHRLFGQAVEGEGADPAAWMGLAAACRALRDLDGELAALDGVLAVRPGDLRALLLKGDRLSERGDSRGASAFYTAALKAAPERPPAVLVQALSRASEAVRRHAGAYEDWLRAALPEAERSPRFAQSLDLLFGRKTIYRQSPRIFYFPELPQMQFYPRAATPWLTAVEARTDAIRAELQAVLADEDAVFEPYVQGRADRPVDDRHFMLRDPDWSAWFLWKDGAPVAGHADRCPATLAALEAVPLCRMPGRTPAVLFSALKGGARIPPHTGYVNTRLICHLALIVPQGCGFRVGNETRAWREGEAFAFDDTVEHEAWNDGRGLRVVLIFDVWRPELSEEERALVTAMFAAIDAYGGTTVEAWSG